MEASFMMAQVETVLTNYTKQHGRSGMDDLAIWQSLDTYYDRADEWEIEWLSTREEVFDRMVKDNFYADYGYGDSYYGIDYESVDEQVLQYLKDNQLVKDIDEKGNPDNA